MDTHDQEMGFEQLVGLFEQTQIELQKQAARSVDIALVVRNWLFGWYIVEYEQSGENRAEYGKELLKKLSKTLNKRMGRGFSVDSLELMRRFYTTYQGVLPSDEKSETLSRIFYRKTNSETPSRNSDLHQTRSSGEPLPTSLQLGVTRKLSGQLGSSLKLSWSHYVCLLTVSNKQELAFYEVEAINENWSLRELKRQIDASLYERLALSRDKETVRQMSQEGIIVTGPQDVIKNPYVLEFLDLDEKVTYSETELETAIIDKLEHFLLELGKGFLFEARQKRFTFDEDHFFVDLVFYNRLLRSYVLIDLKIGELKHQDLGQMQMYVNYFDRYAKLKEENPTVGIILCKKKKDSLVEITLPTDTNIHASEYQLYLPSKEDLKRQLEEAQSEWEEEHES